MHVVIDIPEEEYEFCTGRWDTECLDVLTIAVKYGTPLPKGHGRIGDFDAFLKGFLFDKRADNLECGRIRKLIEQTTIIQADKED